MTAERVLFFSISFIMLGYAIKVQIEMFLDRNKIRKTKGIIIGYDFVLPEAMMHRNAKIVKFEYYLDGKRYISKNSIKMSLSAEIGDIVDIKYFVNDPSILYTKSNIHVYLAMFASLLCFLLGLIS